jgi:2-polyprenyl-3-methyl-5-hydroxy-6-metoxy-1,4-benzoquinol methylase
MNTAMVNCRVCGGLERQYVCSTNNNHSATQPDCFRCLQCGSVYVGNDISDQELGEAYATLDEGTYYKLIESTNVEKLKNITEFLKGRFPSTARIIDIGCGDGTFLRMLKEAGFTDIWGHEIPGHVDEARKYANGVFEDYDLSTIPDRHFDLVTMIDVMEHVRNPLDSLRRVSQILRPRGMLYFHTPRVTLLDRAMHSLTKIGLSRVTRLWQQSRTGIFHLQNYSDRGIRTLLAKGNFSPENIWARNELTFPLSLYVTGYIQKPLGLPKAATTPIARALQPILKGPLNKNKVVVLAMKNE